MKPYMPGTTAKRLLSTPADRRKFYRPTEAARIVGYNEKTIRRFIIFGLVKAIDRNAKGKIRRWYIPEVAVKQLIKYRMR